VPISQAPTWMERNWLEPQCPLAVPGPQEHLQGPAVPSAQAAACRGQAMLAVAARSEAIVLLFYNLLTERCPWDTLSNIDSRSVDQWANAAGATRAVVREMISTSSLSEACHELFARYPLAVLTDDCNGTICTMLLALPADHGAKYFVLSHDRREGKPAFSLRRRRTTDVVGVEPNGGTIVPEFAAKAITEGVPIPRDGSLFGWRRGEAVTALVPVYTTSTPASPDPFLAVMPHTDAPDEQWPPFAHQRLIGQWFWEDYRAGRIILLDGLIAGTSDIVFWADTTAILGSHCCIVIRDIESHEGYKLRRGAYVYYHTLRAGDPVPSFEALLANADKTDLAPRFRSVHM
jgi:hypothetical protein